MTGHTAADRWPWLRVTWIVCCVLDGLSTLLAAYKLLTFGRDLKNMPFFRVCVQVFSDARET